MFSLSLHSTLNCKLTNAESEIRHGLIYLNGAPRGPQQGVVPDDGPPPEAPGDRSSMLADLARRPLSTELKQKLRGFLYSGDFDKQSLVDRYLRRERDLESEQQVEAAVNNLEQQDRQWGTIFTIQRGIRAKIQDLQWRTEGYMDRLPHRKVIFQNSFKEIKELNRLDASVDRNLRRELMALANPTAQPQQPAALTPDDARKIYTLNPTAPTFSTDMKKFKTKIEAARPNDGNTLYRRLLALKQEEALIERNFIRYHNVVEKIISDSLSKVRRKVEKEHALKQASVSVGITLKPGTKMIYTRPDDMDIIPKREGACEISRIEFEDVTIYDSNGRSIGTRPGVPKIFVTGAGADGIDIENGYTLGRFKKWVDAVDAVEVVQTKDELEELLHLKEYDVTLEKDQLLSVMHKRRERDGSLVSTPVYIRITDIRDGVISFDQAVQFAPSFENLDSYEMRESLSFGEFAKWWQRYEVERAINQFDLRELLIKYNENYNKEFGIPIEDNPPIEVDLNEQLRLPDDESAAFTIRSLDTQSLTLDNGRRFTFPEFFYWVKANGVERLPDRKKDADQKKKDEEIQESIVEQIEDEKQRVKLKDDLAVQRNQRIHKYAAEKRQGSLTDSVKNAWFTTHLLSFHDLFDLGKEMVEFVKRRHERRSKGRYAEVLAKMPGLLGTEGERIREESEHGEVGKYKEAMEHWGIPVIKETLWFTNDKDVAKACMQVLIGKGEMRWDDNFMWETLNRLTARYTLKGAELWIPQPHNMPQGESGEDYCRKSIDALWGIGTAAEWFQENTGKYNSHKDGFEAKFKQLENDAKGTGGPKGELKKMLKEWREGKYVNPMEYEAIVDNAIKYGKMTAEDKMFYLIAGVVTHEHNNPALETLLHFDRIGELNSKWLNNFPLLDYFTQEYIFDPSLWDKDKQKFGKMRKMNRKDLVAFKDTYFPNDYNINEPKSEFSSFMWEKMLLAESVRTRISKGLRAADNMDHDDAHLYIPPASLTEIEKLASSSTGNKLYFTTAGYMNAFPGFNHYFITLTNAIEGEHAPEKRTAKIGALGTALNAYIRYDLILDNRYKKDVQNFARLDDHHLNKTPVVDGAHTVGFHREQLRNLIVDIGKAYGQDFSYLFGPKTGSTHDQNEKRKQAEFEARVDQLPDIITRLVEHDKGKKALEVIKGAMSRADKNERDMHGLIGLQDSKAPPLSERRKLQKHGLEAFQIRERMEAEGNQGHGHGHGHGDHSGGGDSHGGH